MSTSPSSRGAIFSFLTSIRGKILVLVGIPVLALIFLLYTGGSSLDRLSGEMNNLVNNVYKPLINDDFGDIAQMRTDIDGLYSEIGEKRDGIKEMLEADRDVHQAFIAEQEIQVLTAPEAREERHGTIEENIQQARDRIAFAAESLDTEESRALYAAFLPAFDTWVSVTQGIAAEALAANGGATDAGRTQRSSKDSFETMRDLIDEMQKALSDRIKEIKSDISERGLAIDSKQIEISGKQQESEKAADVAQGHATTAKNQFRVIALVATVLTAFLGFIIARGISRALGNTVAMIRDIAEGEGDLTQRLEASGGKELEDLAHWFNLFVEKLQGIIRDIASNAETLSGATTVLAETAARMSESAEVMTAQASSSAAATEESSANVKSVATAITQISSSSATVASASDSISSNLNTIGGSVEETSANMNTIASAVTEMSTSIENIAAAVEELSVTLREVSSSSTEAATVTSEAAKMASTTMETVRSLGQSAEEIGNVIAVISEIASQTNLLALNATIEAASAGEKGKGFAVVANEVKELARRTAGSTEEIRTQVENIQKCTDDTVAAIDAISDVIGKIDGIAGGIAVRVEEQTDATNSISRNFAEVAEGASEISRRVEETARGSAEVSGNLGTALSEVTEISRHMSELANATQEIARNASEAETGMNEVAMSVANIRENAGETAGGAEQTRDSAGELAGLATRQKGLVSQFKV